MQTSGRKYTWNDKQDSRIFSKIDRVFVNGKCLDHMPDTGAQVLPEGISDHCPIVIQTKQSVVMKIICGYLQACHSTSPVGGFLQSTLTERELFNQSTLANNFIGEL